MEEALSSEEEERSLRLLAGVILLLPLFCLFRSRCCILNCALAPIMYYAVAVPRMLNGSDVLANSPRVANWWHWVQQEQPVARVLAEVEEGLQSFMGQGG